jgi:hypothetical protein
MGCHPEDWTASSPRDLTRSLLSSCGSVVILRFAQDDSRGEEGLGAIRFPREKCGLKSLDSRRESEHNILVK